MGCCGDGIGDGFYCSTEEEVEEAEEAQKFEMKLNQVEMK